MADQDVHCVHCGSSNLKFKFLNNKKPDQHRYRCLNCEAVFTWEDHKRPKPKHYKKVRNQDPVEIQGQRTQCNKCFAINNARFKFYNNKKETQPRFKCLSCGEFFQMHLEGGVLVAIETSRKRSPRNLHANESLQDEVAMPGTLPALAQPGDQIYNIPKDPGTLDFIEAQAGGDDLDTVDFDFDFVKELESSILESDADEGDDVEACCTDMPKFDFSNI